MKNKPLRLVHTKNFINNEQLPVVLSNLAIAEALLVRAGKDSAMPHFIALVKEIERYYGFEFEVIDDEPQKI